MSAGSLDRVRSPGPESTVSAGANRDQRCSAMVILQRAHSGTSAFDYRQKLCYQNERYMCNNLPTCATICRRHTLTLPRTLRVRVPQVAREVGRACATPDTHFRPDVPATCILTCTWTGTTRMWGWNSSWTGGHSAREDGRTELTKLSTATISRKRALSTCEVLYMREDSIARARQQQWRAPRSVCEMQRVATFECPAGSDSALPAASL